jgi:hypothetical protein
MAEEQLFECQACARELPPSAYYAGNRSTCRECIKRNYREWYQTHKGQRNASTKAWRRAHPEADREIRRRTRERQKRFIEAGKRALGE